MHIFPQSTSIGLGFTLIYSLILTSPSTQSYGSFPSVYLSQFFCQYQWANIYTHIYQMAMTFKKAIHHSIYKDLSTPYVSSDVICMFFGGQFRILYYLNINMAILYMMQFWYCYAAKSAWIFNSKCIFLIQNLYAYYCHLSEYTYSFSSLDILLSSTCMVHFLPAIPCHIHHA